MRLRSVPYLLVLLVAALLAPAAEAQFNPSRGNKLRDARFNRLVVVDSSRGGDFTDISDALSWVETQTRSSTLQWVVMVRPGSGSGSSNYTESAIVIPSHTALVGFPTPLQTTQPTIYLTGTSGALVTLNNTSSLSGFILSVRSALTGATQVLEYAGSQAAYVSNVIVSVGTTQVGDVQTLDVVRNSSTGTLNLMNCILTRFGAATNSRVLANTSTGTVLATLGRWTPGTSQPKLIESSSTGTVRLTAVRLDAGATTDLTVASGGTVQAIATPYATYAGAGVVSNLNSVGWGTSLPAACSVGQVFLDTTGAAERLCGCTAANTWKCSAAS